MFLTCWALHRFTHLADLGLRSLPAVHRFTHRADLGLRSLPAPQSFNIIFFYFQREKIIFRNQSWGIERVACKVVLSIWCGELQSLPEGGFFKATLAEMRAFERQREAALYDENYTFPARWLPRSSRSHHSQIWDEAVHHRL